MKDIIEVTWVDSRLHLQQEPLDGEYEPCLIKSVGYAHIEDKRKIVLVGDLIDADGRRSLTIPMEAVKKVQMLFYK